MIPDRAVQSLQRDWPHLGSGGFSGTTQVAVGMAPRAVALGDLDSPGRLTPSGLPDLGPLVPIAAEIDAAWM